MPVDSRLSLLGVGPKFVALSVLYAGLGMVPRLINPGFFAIAVVPRSLLIVLGGLLLAIGVPFAVISTAAIFRGFPTGKLLTRGVYAMCRHPVYGAWVVFNVPGLIMIVDNWAALWVPLAMYISLRLLVRQEEAELERIFGDEYRAYRERTPAVLPLLWRR